MSQQSFADVFNRARERAGSKYVTQDAQPGSESSSSVQRLMSAQYSRSRFVSVFNSSHVTVCGFYLCFLHCLALYFMSYHKYV